MSLTQRHIQHFYLRTGFGEPPSSISKQLGYSRDQLVKSAFKNSNGSVDISILPDPTGGKEVSSVKVLRMISRSKEQTAQVSLEWTKRMASTKAQLREKMTLFWHDHFATNIPFAYLMQKQNNTLRKHALGNFGELLHAMAKDPAMILFLNNQQNKKRKPNENFAREVMELFTLGEGNYTEQDIKEAARCFTGWHMNRKGEFELDNQHHDHGVKTIFGQTGRFSGEDVLNMLLKNRTTAHHISQKLYRHLIDHNANTAFVSKMTDVLYNSNYSIEAVLRFVLRSDEFYDERNIGTRIASPTELIVRYLRLFNIKFKYEKLILAAQKKLGQVPLFPPNVSGWGSQREWIDSSTLLYRMQIPQLLLGQGSHRRSISVDWSRTVPFFEANESENQIESILESMIQCNKDRIDRSILTMDRPTRTTVSRFETMIKNTLSLPEFQLI